ncbi:RhoGAP-domain-containing protein [Linnemannia elongata]|nr:RhoGAP-domain-containing protein [Linnemannia elongata]
MFADNLEFVSVLVVGSNINTNDRGKEQLTFLVSIGQEVQGEFDDMYPHDEAQELWRVEKQYSDFVNLDSKLRVTQSRNIVNSLPKLPDKGLFSTHAPSKVDARKRALEQYLQQVTSLRIKDTRDLCEFLSTNVVEREKLREGGDAGWKQGYLTKRGKNFGGWKTRYFILKGPVLEYFDSKDGHHLGSISLTHAQIGRQQSQEKSQDVSGDSSKDNSSDPNSYRHAFLILEPKKGQTVIDAKKNPNNVIRHVLCAETDLERDGWVEALLVHVGKENSDNTETGNDRGGKKFPDIQKVSATPIKELQSGKGTEKLLMTQEAYERQQRSLPAGIQGRGASLPQSPTMQGNNPDERPSGELSLTDAHQPPSSKGSQQGQSGLPRNPSSQSLPQDEGGNKSPENLSTSPFLSTGDPAEKKQKSRMTFWPKKSTREETPTPVPSTGGASSGQHGNSTSATSGTQDSSRIRNFLGKSSNSSSGNTSNGSLNGGISSAPTGLTLSSGSYPSLAPVRQVFGVALEQAIEQGIVQPGYMLPAVVYRCIEYLNAHKAKLEEGIYRLSGSTAVIKSLKERFNHDGDFPLLAEEEYYDIHAVAGLLKLFLRELPSSVLTRDLHKDFLQVIELANRTDRVDELTRLVASLPEANYTLLRALTAHLIEIVDNADINKMTARNVGIVFSPTLGIPAGVFALLMSDFDQIFHTHDGRIMPLENSDQQQQQQQQQQQEQQQLHDESEASVADAVPSSEPIS